LGPRSFATFVSILPENASESFRASLAKGWGRSLPLALFPQGRDGPKLMGRTNHLPRIIGEPYSPESRLFVFALANYDPGSA
jgi:hypothetical protein